MTMNERIEKAAREIASRYNKSQDDFRNSVYNVGYEACCLEMAKWFLSHQWISVDEELPIIGKDGYVDVFILVNKNQKTLTYTARFEDNKFWNVDGFGVYQGVTHWMKVPELKKEEN